MDFGDFYTDKGIMFMSLLLLKYSIKMYCSYIWTITNHQ